MIKDRIMFFEMIKIMKSIVHDSATFPKNVFRSDYGRYNYFEFDVTLSSVFWGFISKAAAQQDYVNIVSISPDSVEYFYKEFGKYGGARVKVSANADEYYEELYAHPPSSPLDCLFHSEILVWFPDSASWLVWGERSYGIAVMGLRKGSDLSVDKIALDIAMPIFSLDEALSDLVSVNFRDPAAFKSFSMDFKASYSI